jgi:hypothetical protein
VDINPGTPKKLAELEDQSLQLLLVMVLTVTMLVQYCEPVSPHAAREL